MPRFSIVVVRTLPRSHFDEYLRKDRRLLKDDFVRVPFLSSSPSSPSSGISRLFPRREPFISALQYPVALVAKFIESGSVSARRLEPVQMSPLILDSNIQIQRVAEPFRVQSTHSADLRRIAVTCGNIECNERIWIPKSNVSFGVVKSRTKLRA